MCVAGLNGVVASVINNFYLILSLMIISSPEKVEVRTLQRHVVRERDNS